MANVFDLESRRRPEPDVWQCECGNHTFWLYSDGAIHCSECEREAVEMQGAWHTPATAESKSIQNIVSFSAATANRLK